MPSVDLDRVASSLFASPVVARRIQSDYSIEGGSPQAMAAALLGAVSWRVLRPDARAGEASNADVFHAAVLALASNSRPWASVLRNEARLSQLLCGYDPQGTATALRAGRLDAARVAALLPGHTASSDARAILGWAERLASGMPYCELLAGLSRDLAARGMAPEEVPPAAALVLAGATTGLSRPPSPPQGMGTWKAPGMRVALAVEFLRNLRWSVCRPDHHVRRLLDRWFQGEVVRLAPRARSLADALGARSGDATGFLTYSLVAAAVTPAGRSLAEVDLLVRALGTYVEKKGRESSIPYRLE